MRSLLSLRRPFFAVVVTAILAACFAPNGMAAEPIISSRSTVGEDSASFDWAKLHARARIAYVSSGPRFLATRMIDDNLRTAFPFAATDASPVVIVELAQSQLLHRVSAAFTAEVDRVDIYLLNELPKDPGDLGYLIPFASIVDASKPGTAALDFVPSNVRYVALRWIRHKTRRPFDVSQVSAFSFAPAEHSESTAPSAQTGDVAGPPSIAVVSPL